jgi:hypothetical protein
MFLTSEICRISVRIGYTIFSPVKIYRIGDWLASTCSQANATMI